MKRRLLIVDDIPEYLESLYRALRAEFEVVTVTTAEKAKEMVFRGFDIVLLDIRLDDEDPSNKEGVELLKFIRKELPHLPVVMMTAYGDIDTAVECMKLGALDFIQKDKIELPEFRKVLNAALERAKMERRLAGLERRLESIEPTEIIGDDPKIQEVRRLIQMVAQDGHVTVLIRGETGTGKELVARAIHRYGVRSDGPFVAVTLSALDRETLSQQLFGYEERTSEGEVVVHPGYIEEADKGILFLDKVADLPMDAQLKLLRALDEREFVRVGGTNRIGVDFQLIAATDRDLGQAVLEGTFRKDLYFRLKVVEIYLPPLAERRGDIPKLARYFLTLLQRQGKTNVEAVSDEAMELMMRYSWPGNVRELKHCIEGAALRAALEGERKILPKHLPDEVRQGRSPFEPRREAGPPLEVRLPEGGINISEQLARLELAYIEEALRATDGKKSESWKLLGYNDRFAMLRRVRLISRRYPHLLDEFPYLRAKYGRLLEGSREQLSEPRGRGNKADKRNVGGRR